MNRRHITAAAIPGQPTHFVPVPDHAPTHAVADVAALAIELRASRLWWMVEPEPFRASYYPPRQLLSVLIEYPPWGRPYAIEWRFGRLIEWSDGWYDVGWHPDRPAPEALCQALNRRYAT